MKNDKTGVRFIIGIFLMAVATQVVKGDIWDPGDNLSTGATPLTFLDAVQVHGPHTKENGDDVFDWFSVEMSAGTTYYMESTGPSDMIAFLYSDLAGLDQVAYSDDDSDHNFKLAFMPGESGIFYLKVKQFINSSYDYSLSYYKEDPATDNWDHDDDTGAGATPLTISTTPGSHGPHVLTASDTNDWFRFSLVAGEKYQFETVVDEPSSQDTYGVLYFDAAGASVADEDDDSGGDYNFRITYTPSVSGNYYLRVYEVYNDPAGYSLEYLQIASDQDGDGMTDAWENEYFGSTNAAPTAHGDADVFNNLQEYIAGTDPTNSESFFAVSNSVDNGFIVHWLSVSNRLYDVLWSTNLPDGFQPLEEGINYPQNSFTNSAENAAFYKVNVKIKP